MSEPFFNLDDIMDTEHEGELDTSLIPVPAQEWSAYIDKHVGRTVNVTTGDNPGPRAVVDVTWKITDPACEEACQRANPTVRQSLWLDLNDVGGLDMSKGANIGLGRLREALGQNGPGAWNFNMLDGQAAIVRVSHTRDSAKDITYANVDSVAAA